MKSCWRLTSATAARYGLEINLAWGKFDHKAFWQRSNARTKIHRQLRFSVSIQEFSSALIGHGPSQIRNGQRSKEWTILVDEEVSKTSSQ